MNQTAKELGLTRIEWEILEHRLGVGDAIADALTDCAEGSQPFSTYQRDDIEECAELLRVGKWDQACQAFPEDMIHEIIEDCVDGSTYFADIDESVACGDLSRQQRKTRTDAGYSLAEKVARIIGKEKVSIPML